MKIQQVQSQQLFGAKPRFIEPQQLKIAQELLTKMNSETCYRSRNGLFESKILKYITVGKNSSFLDRRCLIEPKDSMEGIASINSGDVVVHIDVKNGEIQDCVKPRNMRWTTVLKKVAQTLEQAKANFDNSDVVVKHFYSMGGLTKEGYQNLQRMLAKIG